MLLKRSKARQAPAYVDKPFSLKKKAAIAALLVVTSVSVASGSLRSETWRGIEAALLFLLPWFTWKQYKAYARSAVDMSAIETGLGSRRWAFENLLSILHVLLIAVEVASFVVGAFTAGGDAGNTQSSWDQLLTLAFLAIDFMVVLYSAVLSRVLGDFSDPSALVPRTARPELRHPRYVAYKTALNKRMHVIRIWWLLRGLLITIAGFSKLGLAVKQQFFSGPSGGFWPTWETVTSLPSSDASFSEAHPFLAFYGSTGIASLVHRIGLVLYASLLRDHLGSPSPLSPQSIQFNFNLARAVMAALSATVLPLALAVLAAYSLCKWSARDYAVHRLEDCKGETGWYQWDTGSIGSHPCQVLPTRIVASAKGAAANGAVDASSGEGGGAGGAAASRRSASGVSNLNLAKVAASNDNNNDASEAGNGGSKYPTPLLHYLAEGTLAPTSTAISAQQQPTPRQASHLSSLPPVMAPVPRRYPDSTLLLAPRPMRIVILTIGTRGDVQPYVALGLGLKEAGHDVTISSTSDFRDFVTSYGLRFHDTNEPRIVQPEEWLKIGSVAEMISVSAPHIIGSYQNVSKAFYEACAGPVPCDVVIGTAMTVSFALSISEALSVPCWISKLAPEIPSHGFVTPGSGESSIGWLNLLKCFGYWINVANASTKAGLQRCEDLFRTKTLNIHPVKASSRINDMTYTPQLLAFSKHLFPRPADYPSWCFQVGFWATSEAEQYHQKAEARLRYFMDGYSVGGADIDITAANANAGSNAVVPASGKKPSRSSAAAAAAAAADSEAVVSDNLPKLLKYLQLSSKDREQHDKQHQAATGEWPPRFAHQHRVAVVTFGSMVLASNTPACGSASLIEDIAAELLDAHYHVLILTGWVSKAPLSPSMMRDHRVLCIKEAPHDWVFSKASLIVHHGGAGTTGRALSCGVPSMIIPVLRWADQMQWGRIVEARGVGVLVHEANPSREHIRKAISKVKEGNAKDCPFSHTYAGDKANGLGSLVRAETSVESSVALLESCLCNLVLTPEQADAIHPLNVWAADPLKFKDGSQSPRNFELGLTQEQAMCVRHCIPCRRLRAQLALGDTSLFRMVLPHYNGTPAVAAAAAAIKDKASAPLDPSVGSSYGSVAITFSSDSPFLVPYADQLRARGLPVPITRHPLAVDDAAYAAAAHGAPASSSSSSSSSSTSSAAAPVVSRRGGAAAAAAAASSSSAAAAPRSAAKPKAPAAPAPAVEEEEVEQEEDPKPQAASKGKAAPSKKAPAKIKKQPSKKKQESSDDEEEEESGSDAEPAVAAAAAAPVPVARRKRANSSGAASASAASGTSSAGATGARRRATAAKK